MDLTSAPGEPVARVAGTPREVFLAFLRLGLTSFGGPIAHLGYFRDEFVDRRKWIDEKGYADLVAISQFLPGPASSQVGFAIGLLRGGPLGAAAAWTAFTLPSALILFGFAMAERALDNSVGQALLHGLKLVAVAVVAQAVWGMSRSLTPDRTRAGIALTAVIAVIFGGGFGQLGAVLMGGLVGLVLCSGSSTPSDGKLQFAIPRSIGVVSLLTFFVLLFVLHPIGSSTNWRPLALFDAFYRSGALVFGGGHVVLPLLETAVVKTGWVSENSFLAGYGVAQAVPGPLFTFSAYLGAVMGPAPNGALGAMICLLAIFLPGFLLLVGTLPFWSAINNYQLARAAMRGANAAVVGVLGAALYDPVWTGAVLTPADFALAVTGFLLLVIWKVPPWFVVILTAACSVLAAAI